MKTSESSENSFSIFSSKYELGNCLYFHLRCHDGILRGWPEAPQILHSVERQFKPVLHTDFPKKEAQIRMHLRLRHLHLTRNLFVFQTLCQQEHQPGFIVCKLSRPYGCDPVENGLFK